jgi:hypothetical protein
MKAGYAFRVGVVCAAALSCGACAAKKKDLDRETAMQLIQGRVVENLPSLFILY